MTRVGCQKRMIARTSTKWDAGALILTRTTVTDMIPRGTTECIATHRVQWLASLADAWTCVTWITARNARRTRHTTAATLKALRFGWGPVRKPA
jgi:ribulose 1,5-bisphosphate synthetase/thiazole synthase